MRYVITYACAYVPGHVTLCATCEANPVLLALFPALGPVAVGCHQGLCDGCDPAEEEEED